MEWALLFFAIVAAAGCAALIEERAEAKRKLQANFEAGFEQGMRYERRRFIVSGSVPQHRPTWEDEGVR